MPQTFLRALGSLSFADILQVHGTRGLNCSNVQEHGLSAIHLDPWLVDICKRQLTKTFQVFRTCLGGDGFL